MSPDRFAAPGRPGTLTSPRTQEEKAEAFRALHHGDRILVLPNAWDVPSARVFEDAGFPAVATSSAALAAALGYPDGERIPREELLAVVRRIVRALSIPVSVDAESGYGAAPEDVAATARGLLEAGAVGLNLEDASRDAGRALRPLGEQLARLAAVRRAADEFGVPLVVNARTDAYNLAPGDAEARLAEAIRRAKGFETVRVDCVYPMGLADRESISAFVNAVKAPVNVMVRKGVPPLPELERLGVRRLSLGPYPMYASLGLLKRAARELKETGTYESWIAGAITFDELMALAVPRKS